MATPEETARVMPQSEEAETAVLGSILRDATESLDRCIEMLTVEHFYQRRHQVIFGVILAMAVKGEPVDAVTVTTRLKDITRLEEAGGAYYLTELSGKVATTAHVEYFVGVLRDKHQLRQLIAASTRAIESAYTMQDEVEKTLDVAEADIFRVCEDKIQRDVEPIKTIVERVVKKMEEIHSGRGKLAGLSWGFRDLNTQTFGLHPSEMVVIAARPGVGKTALALNVAERLTLDEKIPVAVFSLEMTADQLALRMACSKARISSWQLYHGSVAEKHVQEFSRAAGSIGNSPLFILDTPAITISQLRASARRLQKRHAIKLIIIDYLQLLGGGGMGRNDSREREVAMISGGIKALAKELKIPIIVLSQLNRQMERDERNPKISDLRESGAIEQDADVVCLLARKEAFDKETGKSLKAVEADVLIAKNRNGPVGEIKLTFLPDYTRFEDFSPAEGG